MTDTSSKRSGLMPAGLRNLLGNKLFLLTTVIPTVIAILYFGLIASDVYIAESRFVVRSPERQTSSPLGLILKGAGFSRAQDDSYAVQDYILSRDALKALDSELKVRESFSSNKVDAFSRFAAIDWDNSFEAFHQYYQKKIGVQIDSASSITTLTTRAFSADEAHAMNLRLVEMAEALVNKLNERGRQDMIRFAADEVAQAEKKAKAAGLALAKYRNDKGVIDPEKQSAIPLQQIAKMQDELLTTRAMVMQLEKVAKANPQLPILRQRVTLLEQEIKSETDRVTGSDKSLAGKTAEFQRFVLEKEFAEKMLASAMSTLEMARNEAQRKQLYLERIVQPSVPDAPVEPRRVRGIAATFVLGLILFGIMTMLLAGIREHVD
ncbi:capsule polysaccharide biosynthesis [Azoarcus sp. KH32C]|uniref:capsule polysaccharide biosynthesis n=1 Tax=Azoarcus sp. KH32C TaxID=748247 RepID=UPI00023866B5|nr:capsule polysaccharide biosynthesis [Azoarcus sp. KH32C]BAL22598.1 capsule polysaccharide biosynthesis [Azoarcus sp. KH32C]